MFEYNKSIRYQKGGMNMDGLLLRSIEENIPLEMIYLSRDQQISQRKLLVKEVNEEYIRAYCLLRKQVRIFRKENILSIMPNPHSNERFLH
jgi:predicted DNA-binding transcriptional regulator YafY